MPFVGSGASVSSTVGIPVGVNKGSPVGAPSVGAIVDSPVASLTALVSVGAAVAVVVAVPVGFTETWTVAVALGASSVSPQAHRTNIITNDTIKMNANFTFLPLFVNIV